MRTDARVLWDVVEEHLEEADFLLGQWLRAARSPSFNLDKLHRTVERRLLAHLDGLVVGGQPVADDLLWPALADESSTTLTTAAAASALLLSSPSGTPSPAVIERLVRLLVEPPSPRARAGVCLAFQMAAGPDVDEPLRLALYATDVPATQVALLDALSARRIAAGPILTALLRSDEPPLLAAALRAAAAAEPGSFVHLVVDHLRHADARVREAACGTGVLWNLAAAWSECLAAARDGVAQAMLLAGLVAERGTPALLAPSLRQESQRRAALWALGFSGFPAAVELGLALLDDPDEMTARLAGEVVVAITDLPWESAPFVRAPDVPASDEGELPPLEEDLSVDLEPDPAAELPLLDAPRVRAWWDENQKRFAPDRRYLRGMPAGPAAAVAAMVTGPLRRSGPLAREVAIRTGGRLQLPALRLRSAIPEIPGAVSFSREPSWR